MEQISNKGVALLKILEGCRLRGYDDGTGVMTIGYGYTGLVNGSKITKDTTITQRQADTYLINYLINQDKNLNNIIKVALNQNQYDSLAIFTYNIGINALSKSHLLLYVNHNDFIKASNEFIKWAHPDCLMKRRIIEKNLFMQK
jgi:GH24 family phage-related lysozyme (muramidase)